MTGSAKHQLDQTREAEVRPAGLRVHPLLSGVLIALLCVALGVALATQVQRTRSGDTLNEQRPQDLVVLLDGLQQREAALRKEIADSEATLQRLRAAGDSSAAALEEARRRAAALAVLSGASPAVGPGVQVAVADPAGKIGPDVLLDVLQELRAAGAEAVQVGEVRVGVDSAFSGTAGDVRLDGVALSAPFPVLAIGDPPTLAAALNIPGGVVDTVERVGGTVQLRQVERVEINALRPVRTPKYARPTG
ncbi:hypothetical protein GCM10012275_29570 [Longimycelium tulufanense]|uniref:DUF881 domain-containing protein n=1 Tax=Longimycelium tulufanense TaxID=907463 RepID=A0A8J3C8V5_9PSEU|nr:DUF881 domain-containing protein [Longimycelium tulufanense]GGM56533.1 hypothetical protein GCM10012275_29570 [Longimycelium tulufanense]